MKKGLLIKSGLIGKTMGYLLLLLSAMAWANPGNSQGSSEHNNEFASDLKGVIIDVKLKHASVNDIFNTVESKTNFKFFYDREILQTQLDYSYSGQLSLYGLLVDVSKESDLVFRQVNNNINVKKKEDQKPLEKKVVVQNPVTVIGKVNSEEFPEGIPFVNILVSGTAIGTVTDIEGNYKIEVPSESSILVFSSIGFVSQSITVGDKRVINVTFAEDLKALDEVVVVGFGGTQKRESMVSSVTSVNAKELKVSSSNLTTALAGRIPGVISYQRSGEPGEDNSDFFIRGLGTFGAGKRDPLILIDNIESTTTDLARLQADDIEAFSVLKDATAAAVYGARGANGVILITTKSGVEGKTKFQFRSEQKVSTNTRNFQLADNITYMNLENEAVLTRMDPYNPQPLPYSQKKIERTMLGDNELLYPSNNWIDQLIKKYTYNQSYNINASGGGKRVRYYLAGTYNLDNGVLKVDPVNDFNNNIKLANYSVRSNVNIQLTEKLEAIVRVYGQFDDYTGPLGGIDYRDNNRPRISGGTRIFNLALASNPVSFPAVYPAYLNPYVDHPLFGGALTNTGDNIWANPYAEMVKGYEVKKASTMQPQVELKQNLDFITPGLNVSVMGYIRRYEKSTVTRSYNPFYYSAYESPIDGSILLDVMNDGEAGSVGTEGTETLSFNIDELLSDSKAYFQAMTNYSRTFNEKHSVSGMLIYLISQYEAASKSASTDVQSSLPSRNLGISGRFTYGFDSKYLAEFNFGYNGSERFAEDKRYGFFPSVGLAYHISNESYFKSLKRVVENFKIRGSYGYVGNDAIGNSGDRFFYLSQVLLKDGTRGAWFGENNTNFGPGVSILRYPNSEISWEISRQLNLGIDINLFGDLDIITEVFRQYRTNILQDRSFIGSSIGLNPSAIPKANTGKYLTSGVDFSANYNKYFRQDKWLQLRGNFTYSKAEFVELDEVSFPAGEEYRSRIGYSDAQVFGLIAERLFVDDAEVLNSPAQFGNYRGGDIKYRDVNGDGIISDADRVAIGFPKIPEIIYGFGGTFGYKNFDLGVFFQGAARTSFFIDPFRISPFTTFNNEQNGLLKVIADSHWSETEENRDLYAFWPRLSTEQVPNNNTTSTWWMRNGSFLRLKNVEVGYNFPEQFANRLQLQTFRLYMRGTNLTSWSKFKLWDVEMGGNGLGYPIQAIYAAGVLVTF